MAVRAMTGMNFKTRSNFSQKFFPFSCSPSLSKFSAPTLPIISTELKIVLLFTLPPLNQMLRRRVSWRADSKKASLSDIFLERLFMRGLWMNTATVLVETMLMVVKTAG